MDLKGTAVTKDSNMFFLQDPLGSKKLGTQVSSRLLTLIMSVLDFIFRLHVFIIGIDIGEAWKRNNIFL